MTNQYKKKVIFQPKLKLPIRTSRTRRYIAHYHGNKIKNNTNNNGKYELKENAKRTFKDIVCVDRKDNKIEEYCLWKKILQKQKIYNGIKYR